MIVFQRLEIAPLHGLLARIPSGEFDGLLFKDGAWALQKDVEIMPKDFKK
jgi:hypothetical protein